MLYDEPLKEPHTHTYYRIFKNEWQTFRHGFRKMIEFQNEFVSAQFTTIVYHMVQYHMVHFRLRDKRYPLTPSLAL